MNWLKKAYKDPGTRLTTWALLAGGPVWSILTYFFGSGYHWWIAGVFGWAFYLLIFLPMVYLHRNNP